jgi:GMP synthase-like glutamine amidotransferase
MFADLLNGAARRLDDLPLELAVYRITESEFPATVSDCDGYVITGSRQSVYDDLPWITELADFLAQAMAAEVRIVGICFGHQLLAHFFGGLTEPAATGWVVGVHETRVLESQSWMQPACPEFALLSSHKDQVARLPEGAQTIASSDACPHAGFIIGERVMTLQGHPEFNKPYAAALMGKRQTLIGPTTFARGMDSLSRETHSEVIGQWLLNFLRRS